jgi:hypothetical protein
MINPQAGFSPRRLYCPGNVRTHRKREFRAFCFAGRILRRNLDEENRMKKIGFLTLLITATLLLTLALPVGAAGPKAAPVAAAPVPASPVVAPPVPPHPEIHAALEAMRDAKRHLESAAHDFHGHRVKSLDHLNQAIREAEICEQEP